MWAAWGVPEIVLHQVETVETGETLGTVALTELEALAAWVVLQVQELQVLVEETGAMAETAEQVQ